MDRTLIFFFRLAVFAASCAFLYTQALAKDSWLWREAFAASLSWPLAIVMLLALLNWGIEAFKWKLLMRPVEVMPYGNAVRATLAGTSIGLFTPNRSGEFVGRLWFVKPGGRMRAGFATVLGSMAQFTSTMLAGAVAVGVVFWTGAIVPWQGTWIADVMVVAAVFIAAASLLLLLLPTLAANRVRRLTAIAALSGIRNNIERVQHQGTNPCARPEPAAICRLCSTIRCTADTLLWACVMEGSCPGRSAHLLGHHAHTHHAPHRTGRARWRRRSHPFAVGFERTRYTHRVLHAVDHQPHVACGHWQFAIALAPASLNRSHDRATALGVDSSGPPCCLHCNCSCCSMR
ncbi:MAG: flippase-like domain-containing protein [Flavobacteriales bacterium]|nr:flippase-like domain-containing protein [Flavobacteriales bacterium]